MKVSEILRAVKSIDRELHDALENALEDHRVAHYHYRYAQFTSLEHCITSGFSWKQSDKDADYWQHILNGIHNCKDGSSEYFSLLSFISEQHRKKPDLIKGSGTCAAKIINEVILVNPEIGKRILIEYQRYNPGELRRMKGYLTLLNVITSIFWSRTKEGYSWWDKLKQATTDENGNLLPEQMRNYEKPA
ncbi:MAG: hypothetical protein ACR2K1_08340 [Saprospiraceae bacterium]